MIGGYFPEAVYEKFAHEYRDHVIAEYSIKTTSTAALSEMKNTITEMLREKGIALLNINDRDTSKQTRTMVCTTDTDMRNIAFFLYFSRENT